MRRDQSYTDCSPAILSCLITPASCMAVQPLLPEPATCRAAMWMQTASTVRSQYFRAPGVPTMTAKHIEDLINLLNTRGGSAYFGEPVSVLEHSLQAAHSAELARACAAAICAALLHDVGHMLHGLDEDIAHRGLDGMHEEIAGEYLAPWFGEDVTTPIRLHVPA